MYCLECGKKYQSEVKFCGNCGAKLSATSALAVTSGSMPSEPMTFGKSIATCYAKYFDFKGRASRPEYWWFYLFGTLLSWGAMLVDKSMIVWWIIYFVNFFPGIAAGSRRLHDTNRSGWWQLLALTLIGFIPLIVWLASKGSDQENQYGSPA